MTFKIRVLKSKVSESRYFDIFYNERYLGNFRVSNHLSCAYPRWDTFNHKSVCSLRRAMPALIREYRKKLLANGIVRDFYTVRTEFVEKNIPKPVKKCLRRTTEVYDFATLRLYKI